MTFLNFLYQKVESAGLLEIVLESFPNNDDSVFFTNETCKKKATPRDTITLEGLQIKISNEVVGGF